MVRSEELWTRGGGAPLVGPHGGRAPALLGARAPAFSEAYRLAAAQRRFRRAGKGPAPRRRARRRCVRIQRVEPSARARLQVVPEGSLPGQVATVRLDGGALHYCEGRIRDCHGAAVHGSVASDFRCAAALSTGHRAARGICGPSVLSAGCGGEALPRQCAAEGEG